MKDKLLRLLKAIGIAALIIAGTAAAIYLISLTRISLPALLVIAICALVWLMYKTLEQNEK